MISPVTVIGLPEPWAVIPPGLEVTVYEVMALPPSDAGGVKLTVAWALPAVAVPIVGAPGTVAVTPVGAPCAVTTPRGPMNNPKATGSIPTGMVILEESILWMLMGRIHSS